MSKILGSWSGMRKYLEKEMLAPSLQGRIRYNCTRYVGMDNCFIFEIFVDKKLIKQFSYETVNTYFINNGYNQNKKPTGIKEYWAEYWDLYNKIPPNSRNEYSDEEFCDALKTYRNQSIQNTLLSENPLERMFAILDYRVGKRTLLTLANTVESQPIWLQFFYKLRSEAVKMLNKIKLIILILSISIITACSSENNISKTLNIDISSGTISHTQDSHGGFHNDGLLFTKITFADNIKSLKKEIENSSLWIEMPIPTDLSQFIINNFTDENGNSLFPSVENGYFFFKDRHSDNKNFNDISAVLNRQSFNFTIAIFDEDTKTIYYAEFDT